MAGGKRFILVHGALHGAWCWEKVVPLLELQGHSVQAVDLPGRAGKGKPGWRLSLDDYIDDLAQTVAKEPAPVVLVGHSLGGMLISGVAERMPDKIERLIYLTAWVPLDGRNMIQLGQLDKASQLHRASAASLLRGLVVAKPGGFRDVFYFDCDDEDVRNAETRLVPESIRTALGRVALTPERFGRVPASYVVCEADKALTPALQRRMAASIHATVVTLPSSHSPFFSMPRRLTDTLHQALQ